LGVPSPRRWVHHRSRSPAGPPLIVWIVCTIQIQGYRHNASSCRDRQCRQFAGCRCGSGIDLQGSATRSSPTGPTDSGLHQHPPSRLRSCGGCSSATIWPSRAPTRGVIRNMPRPRARTRRTRVGVLRAAAVHGPSRPPRSGPSRPGGRARDFGRSVCWLAGRELRKVAERGVDHKTARCYVTAAEGCAGTPESRR